jgi:tricarballylate dehydrogenase
VRSQRPEAPIYGHAYGILVNAQGQRFIDEGAQTIDDSFERVAYEVWRNQNQVAYFITDEEVMSLEAVKSTFWTDVPPVQARTIEELAAALDLDPVVLSTTIEEYNAACAAGDFDPTRMDGVTTTGVVPPKSNWALPISQAPYYGYPMTTAVTFTFGGIRTDDSGRVVSTVGQPIPGLYAAGEVVGLYYHQYLSSTSVLKALTYGRIAGRNAARYVRTGASASS